MSYQSGPFQAFYAPTTGSGGTPTYAYIGTSRDGWTRREVIHKQVVKDDLYGEAEPDSINQGVDYELEGVSIEWDKLISSGIYNSPLINATIGSPAQQYGFVNADVGYRNRDLAGSLVLTPKPFTPAALLIGAGNSYVFFSALIMNNLDVLYSSKLFEVPVTFKLYPCGPLSYYTGTYGTSVFGVIATPSGCTYPATGTL